MKVLHNGVEKEINVRSLRLGDKVAAIATPIARALNLPCIDPETKQFRPESGCAKRKEFLNNLGKKKE